MFENACELRKLHVGRLSFITPCSGVARRRKVGGGGAEQTFLPKSEKQKKKKKKKRGGHSGIKAHDRVLWIG